MSTKTGEIEMEGGSTSHGLEETNEITQESTAVVKKSRAKDLKEPIIMSTETGEIEMEGGSTSHGLEETHEITQERAVAVRNGKAKDLEKSIIMSTETGEMEMEGGSTSHGLEETHEITEESTVEVKKGSTSRALIDIQELEKIRKKGTELSRSSPDVCIFQVPECLKSRQMDVYVPEVVGLGPFHHHHTLPHLKEVKREAVLRTLLKMYPHDPLAVPMEKLRNEVMGMKATIENCYEMSFFFDLDIFILDSCFLLQFLFPMQPKFAFPRQREFDYARGYNWEGFGKASHSQISRDLMKLENQIPLKLLQKLIKLQDLSDDIMLGMAKQLFGDIDKLGDLPSPQTWLEPRHLLEYNQQFISNFVRGAVALPDDTHVPNRGRPCGCGGFKTNTKSEKDDIMWSFPSARELEKAGIELKRGKKMSFERKWCGLKGVLTIPPLIISDDSEVNIKNTIAFEECLPQDDRLFTWFMSFLNCLIDKDTDVEILRRANIIDNLIQSHQATADLVNSSCVNVSFAPDHMDLKDKMKAYYRSSWRVMIKEFMDTHISKPWLFIGMLAAIALLGLTITQTIYAVESYKPGK